MQAVGRKAVSASAGAHILPGVPSTISPLRQSQETQKRLVRLQEHCLVSVIKTSDSLESWHLGISSAHMGHPGP